MKKSLYISLVIFIAFLIGCSPSAPIIEPNLTPENTITSTRVIIDNETPKPTSPRIVETVTATPTPDLFSSLHGCEMDLSFLTGPLESKTSEFSVLDKEYFFDKGDKFAVGKGTSIFYEAQRYFIIHSSYVNGNMLKPMEAEFMRRYLENWANTGPEYIQGQIDALIGSEATWTCDGELTFNTKVNGVVRLSHEASDRLWLNPEQLEDILADKEGLVSEWIGGIDESTEPTMYVGFCGWGPNTLKSGRYTYYRYLISFEVL